MAVQEEENIGASGEFYLLLDFLGGFEESLLLLTFLQLKIRKLALLQTDKNCKLSKPLIFIPYSTYHFITWLTIWYTYQILTAIHHGEYSCGSICSLLDSSFLGNLWNTGSALALRINFHWNLLLFLFYAFESIICCWGSSLDSSRFCSSPAEDELEEAVEVEEHHPARRMWREKRRGLCCCRLCNTPL
ncbi:hypothetical protein MtrunA17_Chr6g0477571 [Medicago truncatula]|uniref:Transmembrane protein, putative n=1 Tax=Medicago truncatula TaxID=3880 RepID=A0A072TIG9_MEDTR|nr:transmembrane protein, putative [Medicago truncatula]RHN52174.1 hypothetical protein MtrunA17_Chr6g0477571 [Medicago truncatula]